MNGSAGTNEDTHGIEQAVRENNFQVKFKLHQIQDQLARGDRSMSSSTSSSSGGSMLSMEISRLKEQLEYSDMSLNKLTDMHGQSRAYRSLQDVEHENKLAKDRVWPVDSVEDVENEEPKEQGNGHEQQEGIAEGLPQLQPQAKGWINASPKKTSFGDSINNAVRAGQFRGNRQNQQNDEKQGGLDDDLKNAKPSQPPLQPQPQFETLEDEHLEQTIEDHQPQDIQKDETQNIHKDDTQELEKDTQEIHQRQQQPQLAEPPIEQEELENFDLSLENPQLQLELESPVRRGEPEHYRTHARLPKLDPVDYATPPEPVKSTSHESTPTKASIGRTPRDAFDTSRAPRLTGFEPLQPANLHGEQEKEEEEEEEEKGEDGQELQNGHEFSESHQDTLMQQLEASPAQRSVRFEQHNDNHGDDPFRVEIDPIDFHTQSLVSENKSLREELVSLQSQEDQNLLDTRQELAALRREHEQLKEKLKPQSIVVYSNERLRAQRNDLAFLTGYLKNELQTHHGTIQHRLELLAHAGMIDIRDDMVYEIMAGGGGSTNNSNHSNNSNHIYTRRRKRVTFKSAALMVVAAIKLRNRYSHARSNLAQIRTTVRAR